MKFDADGRAPLCAEVRERTELDKCQDPRCIPCHNGTGKWPWQQATEEIPPTGIYPRWELGHEGSDRFTGGDKKDAP